MPQWSKVILASISSGIFYLSLRNHINLYLKMWREPFADLIHRPFWIWLIIIFILIIISPNNDVFSYGGCVTGNLTSFLYMPRLCTIVSLKYLPVHIVTFYGHFILSSVAPCRMVLESVLVLARSPHHFKFLLLAGVMKPSNRPVSSVSHSVKCKRWLSLFGWDMSRGSRNGRLVTSRHTVTRAASHSICWQQRNREVALFSQPLPGSERG